MEELITDTELFDKPYRLDYRRKWVIKRLTELCHKNTIPILIDLNCYPLGMLQMAFLKLQLAELNKTDVQKEK